MAEQHAATGSGRSAIEGELALYADTQRPMRIGLVVLALGFGGFIVWAACAPLDEGVPAQGVVSIDTKRKPVQHLTGGLVTEILVREGQIVDAGQVVARLDTAVSRANFESVRQHYMGLRAMESRLVAEQGGTAQLHFSEEVMGSKDRMVQQQVATQLALFASNRRARAAELQGIRESILGQEAKIQGHEGQLLSQRQQNASLREELAGIRDLVAENYAPRAKQLELERQVAATQGAMTESQGNISQARRAIAELQQRAEQRQQEHSKESDSKLAEIRLELQADQEKVRASSDDLGRTELRAPVAGQVVGLSVQAAGAVIQSGQKLMDIVPADESLLIETRIAPHMIDRVAAGQQTDVRFSTFSHSPLLVVEGRLESVSHDLITENGPAGPITYYLGRVAVTPAGMKTLGARQMQAGMPAEVVIKTGERSFLTYLLHPLTKRLAAAMKEE